MIISPHSKFQTDGLTTTINQIVSHNRVCDVMHAYWTQTPERIFDPIERQTENVIFHDIQLPFRCVLIRRPLLVMHEWLFSISRPRRDHSQSQDNKFPQAPAVATKISKTEWKDDEIDCAERYIAILDILIVAPNIFDGPKIVFGWWIVIFTKWKHWNYVLNECRMEIGVDDEVSVEMRHSQSKFRHWMSVTKTLVFIKLRLIRS